MKTHAAAAAPFEIMGQTSRMMMKQEVLRRNHNAAAEAVDQEKKAPATHQDTTHTRSKQNQHANCLRHCIKPRYKGPACRKDYEALTADASKRMPTPRSNPISPCSKPRYKGPTCRNGCEALAADASKRMPTPRSKTLSPGRQHNAAGRGVVIGQHCP